MNRCPAGHHVSPDLGDKFCSDCGAALVPPPRCVCGRELILDMDKHCPRCGLPVRPQTDAMRRCAATGEGRDRTC